MNNLWPLVVYCVVMSSTPGPNNLMLTAAGARFGYRGALPQILGILSGTFLQTWLCCLGLGALFMAWPGVQAGLRIAGAVYLAYLAWKLSGINRRVAPGDQSTERPMSFTEGALFQAVNPKSWVKALTLASVFMPTGMAAWSGSLLTSAISSAVGFPCISMWALFGVAIRRHLTAPRKQRAFNLLMAGSLMVLALMFLR